MTRQISMTTRKELVEALRERYRRAAFGDRVKILDEFVALTGYHRKHAIRVLCDEVTKTSAAPARNRLYDEAVRQALTMLWEAADRVCGKRLKALIPLLVDAMERHGHLDLDPVIRRKVLQVSAAISTACSPPRACTSTDSASAARGWARPSDAVFRCALSPTGEIHRQDSSRSTWSSTVAARRRMATTFIR